MSSLDQQAVGELRRSISIIGQIYSIIVDSDGEVLAGKHREGAGATKRHGIDTEDLAKKIGVSRVSAKQLIIMHSNVQRQVSKEETRAGLLKLANGFGVQGFPKEKIAAEIAKWVPYTPQYIRELLPDEYKQESKAREFAKPVSQTRAPEPLP